MIGSTSHTRGRPMPQESLRARLGVWLIEIGLVQESSSSSASFTSSASASAVRGRRCRRPEEESPIPGGRADPPSPSTALRAGQVLRSLPLLPSPQTRASRQATSATEGCFGVLRHGG